MWLRFTGVLVTGEALNVALGAMLVGPLWRIYPGIVQKTFGCAGAIDRIS